MTSELKRTLSELVAFDTTSARTNAPLISYAEARLAKAGFDCVRQTYRDEAGVEKTNLVAARGQGQPELALVGHSDCVPYDPQWREALVLTEEGDRWVARGAADTKAFVACALHAVEAERTRRPIVVIYTADEEVGCVGAKKLLDANAVSPKRAIIGEPTSLTPIRAHKGYCLAEIEVHGKEGHSAYPATGASAIFRAARLLQRIEEASNGELRRHTDVQFDPPFTTVNVGMISGGKAKNIIPGSCRFIVEWRPIPSQPNDRWVELMRGCIAELERSDSGFRATLRVSRADPGVDTPESAEVVQFLRAESGRAPQTVSFGTEMPYLTKLGAESVVFGPGDIKHAHQTGEWVPIAEVVRCEEVLRRAIARFCG